MKNQLISTLIILMVLFIALSCKKDEDTESENPNTCTNLNYSGKEYKTVKIGDQCWMAENFEYYTGSGSWDIPFPELAGWGKLYNYSSATLGAPDGWHLPSLEEWRQLARYISDQHGGYDIIHEDYQWADVGKHLKSKDGWPVSWWAGTDDYGFRALPAGQRSVELSLGTASYDNRKMYAFFWTSTQEANGDVRLIMLSWETQSFYTTSINEIRLSGDGLSVRYLKD